MAKNPIIRLKEVNKKTELTSTPASEIFETINERDYSDLPVLSASQELGMVYRNENGGSSISYNKDNLSSYKHICPGQFAIHLRSFQGGFAHSDKEGICSPAYTIMRFKTPIHDEYYWKYLLTSEKFIKRLELITYGIRDGRSINFKDFSTFNFDVPSFNEQKDIGTFFTHIASLIASTQEKLEKAIILKKSMLEKMFPQNDAKIPELRFTGFSDEWQVSKLSNFLEVVTEKNESEQYGKEDVLSVSGDYGVVNQIEHQGKSLAGASLINYGVVHTGDVVYTKSPLKEQPYGIIKTNKGKTGIVSALYGIFRKKGEILTDFIQYYFESDRRLNEYLRPLVNKGAKNTLLVSDEDSIKGIVSIPSIKEQEAIIKYFDECSKLITNYRNELEKLKTIKKSLLEKMFV